ncbi:hypothetical protein M0805_004901 [Coniferiporia weirii]|nr:hypothetical protein M0805_004901 [Coniferiporia weirii]
MSVSHTCHDWRNIALSSGVLWSRLSISYYRGQKSKVKEALDTWLQRSRNSPLCYHIYITIGGGYESPAYLTAEDIVTSMLQHQKRWKEIKLSMDDMYISPALQGMKAVEMPALTSLSWSFLSNGNPVRTICVDISSSRHLKDLELVGAFNLRVGNAPFQSLTDRCKFSIYRNPYTTDTDICLALLQVAPNLKRFDGEFDEHEFDEHEFDEHEFDEHEFDEHGRSRVKATLAGLTLVLPRLRIVYLEGEDFGFPILSRLTLPGLEALSLSTEGGEMGPLFLGCVLRSLPPLTFLEISGQGVAENELICALQHLPALRELRIFSNDSYSKAFLDALTINGGLNSGTRVRVRLCPKLETLWLVNVYGLEGHEKQVSRMIASRWCLSEAFSLAGISDCELFEDHILESPGMLSYIEEGLKLEFSEDIIAYSPFDKKERMSEI